MPDVVRFTQRCQAAGGEVIAALAFLGPRPRLLGAAKRMIGMHFEELFYVLKALGQRRV